MGVSIRKGQRISLRKASSDSGSSTVLTKIKIGLGWKARITSGDSFDLDATAFMLQSNGKVPDDRYFIFYGQMKSPSGSVEHMGDEREGNTADIAYEDEDEEEIYIDLTAVPHFVNKVAICVSIHEASQKNQNFGMVEDAYVRVVNAEDEIEIARYDLSEDASIETAMIFAEVYNKNNEWRFRAIGQGFAGGLGPLARHYGVDVEE